MRSAAEVSIETIRACATGLRRTRPCSIRGTTRSPTNCAFPRSFSCASRRGRGEDAARADGQPVHEHRACPADLDVAGALRAGEPEVVAEQVEQQLLRLDLAHELLPVDPKRDLHGPSCASTPPSTRPRI